VPILYLVPKINGNIEEQIKISYRVLTYTVIALSAIYNAAFEIDRYTSMKNSS
jgi:hypothetical protein